jgi:sugar lactone lactonase YvrE
MRRSLTFHLVAALLICAAPAFAQQKATAQNVPEIPYDSVPNFIKMPAGMYLGEAIGVATNSKGHVFVYTRSANTRLFEFDQNGTFVREIGEGAYNFEFAHSVRVDPQDNIWVVDEGTNTIVRFNPQGHITMVMGRRPPAVLGMQIFPPPGPTPPAAKYTYGRPTDVAWDPQGNIFISDGYVNARVVKYDKDGRFIKQIGSEKTGKEPGEFSTPHGIAVDHNGDVYVADRGNNRMQVLDNNLNVKRVQTNIGVSWAVCVSPGPHQYVFSSNSNPNGNTPGSWANTGEIYKMELDGTILGKFGHAGKRLGGFQVVHTFDCRNPNSIIVAEIESWRVQRLNLHPAGAAPVKTNTSAAR